MHSPKELSMMDELWQNERSFWLEGIDFFETQLARECLMVLPGMGILDRTQVVESLRNAPRWSEIEMQVRREAMIGTSVALLAYNAVGHRDHAPLYRATCTSAYVLEDHRRWRMVQHQQTPAS
jgi:hypothetical protein